MPFDGLVRGFFWLHVVSGLILRGVSEYAANKRDGGVKYDKQEGVPSAGGSGPSSEILVGILNLQQQHRNTSFLPQEYLFQEKALIP